MKFARRDIVRVFIVAGFVTQLAPFIGVGNPQRRHLYIVAPALVVLILIDNKK